MTNETRTAHPSFGFIRASRVSGGAALFDSALVHHSYISITIGRAEQVRQHHHERNHPGDELVRVAMSEAQFAQFITSMNMGTGSPCTLERIGMDSVPPPPRTTNNKGTFTREARETAEKATEGVRSAAATVRYLAAKGKANKSDLNAVAQTLARAEMDLIANLPFVLASFVEAVENVTQAAKMEVNAHVAMLGQRLGVPGEDFPVLNAPADAIEGEEV